MKKQDLPGHDPLERFVGKSDDVVVLPGKTDESAEPEHRTVRNAPRYSLWVGTRRDG